MKIFKVLKHSKKDSIYVLDEKQNHQYILSMIAVTMMAYQAELSHIVVSSTDLKNRISRKYAQVRNIDLIDIIMENDITFNEKVALIQEYCKVLNEQSKLPINFIETINVTTFQKENQAPVNPFTVRRDGQITGASIQPNINRSIISYP